MDLMQSFDAILFPADGRPPHVVSLMTSPASFSNPHAPAQTSAARVPHPEVHMEYIEPQPLEAHHRPPNPFPLSTPPQPQNHVLHNTGVSLSRRTFSLLQVLTYMHDALQIPSVTGTDQLQVQWDDVPPTVGNSAAQGTLWDSHHTYVVNYATADYPEHASVSNDLHICTINVPIDPLATHQDLARPYTHLDVGPACAHQQGIEHVHIMSNVSANLSSLHMFQIKSIVTGEFRK